MKKTLAFLTFLVITVTVYGQRNTDKITDSIVQEGKMLYKSEMASWYGTDIFVAQLKSQQKNAGGYFSYTSEGVNNCLFFSKDSIPKTLCVISFDDTYDIDKAQIDTTKRFLTPQENDLYQIRKQALKEINSSDSFKRYENTSLNLIPLIQNGLKKVYVLTGTSVTGVMVIGNDYLLTFDSNNQLISTKKLHKTMLAINYSNEGNEKETVAMHTHLPETGDFITATDVCTLMLYEKFAKWETHYIISANYVCIWDCKKDELLTLTKEAWDKIYNHQKVKKGN